MCRSMARPAAGAIRTAMARTVSTNSKQRTLGLFIGRDFLTDLVKAYAGEA